MSAIAAMAAESVARELAKENAALRADNEQLRGFVRFVNRVASPNPTRTFDEMIHDMGGLCDRARAVLARLRSTEGRS